MTPERVFKCISGSVAYGLNVEGSDTDMRGIFVQPLRERLSLLPGKDTDESGEGDVLFMEIKKFFMLACQGSPNVIELLWVGPENIIHKDDRLSPLFSSRDMFITEKSVKKMAGYAKGQLHLAESKKGITATQKNKALMHAARTAISALSMVDRRRPVVKNDGTVRDFLLRVRAGEEKFNSIYAFAMETSDRAVDAAQGLEKEVDMEKANRLFLDVLFSFY